MKLKFLEEPSTYVLIYAFMLVFTFGHCFNTLPSSSTRMVMGKEVVVYYDAVDKSVGSLLSSIVWPLYWSVELQK